VRKLVDITVRSAAECTSSLAVTCVTTRHVHLPPGQIHDGCRGVSL